ncbi:TBC1 domain family member 15 isoform X3 [Esox lucius]|uniref:Rab-GAP TBC domain-containing protein n=1 Tax=Esox lucius TaxID=8010 RepID=A0A6Q2YZQ6_ESOLU|nr:TBC1 domain family member 15 isoform X3 [Esox lucius]
MDAPQANGQLPSPTGNIIGSKSSATQLGACDGTPLQTIGISSPVYHVTEEFGDHRKVASFYSPAPCMTPLGLPGVMDAEGRVDESRLRMHIFKNGGVSLSERGQVWRFLFGMYPCSSTSLERPLLQEQLSVRYHAMKMKWHKLLPSTIRMRLNGTDAELVAAVQYFDARQERVQQQAEDQSDEVRERLSFLELQAQVLLERVTFDLEELQEAIRIIDKDVPRTDRDLPYYSAFGVGERRLMLQFTLKKRPSVEETRTEEFEEGEGLGNLLVLRDILITYAAFHPEVSYAQGMNDLCSRFLEVLDSEVDTYWSFSCYMEKFSKDFRADGLHRKIELEAALLKELDPQLHTHLITDNMESFTFCHRWLLLGFQREFEHYDALRLFEILSCDHLELISQKVDRARYQERIARRHSIEDKPVCESQAVNTEFTFELFICATILLDNRDALLRCRNDVQLIQFANSLQGTLDLNSTLKKAEEHFYNYCKRSTWDYMNSLCRARKNKEDHFLYQLRSFFS